MPLPSRLVVDASVAVKWLVPEPDTPRAFELFASTMLAPELIDPECLNALWVRVRRREITREQALTGRGRLETAPVSRIPHVNLASAALDIAFELDHPVYDCFYLALAAAEDIPIVTSDRRLLSAAAKNPVHAARVLPLASIPLE
jgi:predicted nucleic acid-binding protein